jgi:16S rRNA (adenine1518-N6/adenine1519-N6)-dimethyltransferase
MIDLDRPMQRGDWIATLGALGIRPSRALGQNFLVEPSVVERIAAAAEIQPGETVIEVGPGLGILTRELLRTAGRVVAIELDRDLAAHLRHNLAGRTPLELVESDALKVDLGRLLAPDETYSIVANLPYSSASAIIRFFLEQPHPPRRMTVMVQREVAERLVASPPSMSILSVATQFYASGEIAFHVPPGAFVPSPKVESSVVTLDVRTSLALPPDARGQLFALVNAGFRHKRKTLANSLADETREPKSVVAERLAVVGIDPLRRAQTLSLDEWLDVARAWPLEPQ